MIGAKKPGIPCPRCGGASRVYNSRPNPASPAGGIRRSRRCLDCSHTFGTNEELAHTPDADPNTLSSAAELGRLYIGLARTDRAALLRLARALAGTAAREEDAPCLPPSPSRHEVLQ